MISLMSIINYVSEAIVLSNSMFEITADILARSLVNFVLSIYGQTREFIINATCHQPRADNLLW